MTKGLVSFQNIDAIFEETARAVFKAIRPRILLIGQQDAHFDDIAQAYQWAEHKAGVPNQLGADIALIVVNSKAHLKRVLSRAHPYTAILTYDDAETIPLATRTGASPYIVAYLKSVSARYVRGHVRTLLQLQKHFITVDRGVPVIATQSGARQTIDRLFACLDDSGLADVNCNQIDSFFACFKTFAELTSYESPVLVSSPKEFKSLVKRNDRTLVLHCRKKADIAAYKKCALGRRSIVFVHDYTKAQARELDLIGLGQQIEDFYLMAYFLSLQSNLIDPLHNTRFIQTGDIDRVRASHPDTAAFCTQVKTLLNEGTLKFRNTPPKITNVDFAAEPLSDLISRLDKAIYRELIAQCDNGVNAAEYVSATPLTTLFDKKKQYEL